MRQSLGRITASPFQFKFLPKGAIKYIEAFADIFWLFFNIYFVYLAIDFIFNKDESFPVLANHGFPSKLGLYVLPIASR